MIDLLKNLLELVPIVREAPWWFRGVFVTWVFLSAVLAVGIVILKLLAPACDSDPLSVTLTENEYIDARQIALEGGGLASLDELRVRVRWVHDGVREDVNLPTSATLLRSPSGGWRFEWIEFKHPGPHEVLVERLRAGKQVDFVGPYTVQVGAWVPAPSSAAHEPQAGPLMPLEPSGVDLSSFTTIHDQGPEGTSPSFAFVTALETGLGKANAKCLLSARYLYEKAKLHDELGSKSEGTWLEAIVYVAERFGVPLESAWPYRAGNRSLPQGSSWAQLDSLAGIRARTYRLRSLDDISAQLKLGRAVVAGVRIFESGFYRPPASQTGEIPVPRPGEMPMGLHAIAIVGYDSSRAAFRFANSWGRGWGNAGFGTLGRDAAEKCIDLDQLWAVEPIVSQ